MQTGAELFVDAIEQHGIREIFTLVGDHLNEVLLCAGGRGLRIVDMRHEAAVVHAADAWARLHRKPALALVTGGPGHTNAVTGVATAFAACSPVIAVSGSRASVQAQGGAFQELDQVGILRPIVKWAAEPVHVSQIPFYMGRAFAEAMSGRPGPVHLTIPVDLFAASTDQPLPYPGVPAPGRPAPNPEDLERAIGVLREADRPVIIAGAGVWWSDAGAELAAFAEHASIPVYTVSLGRGVYPDTGSMSMGYADVSLNRAAGRAFAEADVVLVVGKRVDFRLAMGSSKVFPAATKFVQVDLHPAEIGINRRIDVGICADAKQALVAAGKLGRSNVTGWMGQPSAELPKRLARMAIRCGLGA
jgi:acetolactate synthase-1/2/3 large subunit